MSRFQKDYYEYQSSGQIATFLLAEIKENPGGVIGLYAIKVARSWYGTDAHRTNVEWILAAFGFGWLICFFFGFKERLFNHDHAEIAILLLAILLSFWLLNAVTSSLFRYMLPIISVSSFIVVKGAIQLMSKLFDLSSINRSTSS